MKYRQTSRHTTNWSILTSVKLAHTILRSIHTTKMLTSSMRNGNFGIHTLGLTNGSQARRMWSRPNFPQSHRSQLHHPHQPTQTLEVKFTKGGAGSPQAGEISMKSADFEAYKWFGVLGQSKTLADNGFSAKADRGSTCYARYVALNVHVHDDSGVSASDEIKIEVSVQKKMTAKELDFKKLPNPPSASFRGDPKVKFETD